MPKAKDVIGYAQDKKAVMVDLKFMDFLGLWQHFTIPIAELTEAVFEEGLGFDGSSIRGWMPIHASDMLVFPDPDTGTMDPFMKDPTLSLICNIVDPITKEPYSRDPRYVAQKAEKHLKSTGVGDVAYFGPEAEFFIFDGVSYDTGPNHGHYKIESREGQWETGSAVEHVYDGKTHGTRPNLGYKPRYKEGYFPVAPIDSLQDVRTEMCRVMEQVGIQVERQHHEVATAGDGYAGMSEMAMHYIGGLLKHSRALAALCNPTTNSYKRLVPGFEAPVNLAYSSRNRSAAIRIPMYSPSPKAKRLEFRSPDSSCNPYLAFAAQLMAGLDGIENKIDPGDPLDKDIYGLSPEELKDVPKMPGSLEEALDCLRKDHRFLLKGDVFTEDVIHTWIDYKTQKEVNPVRLRPHPMEFALYFDI